MWRLSETGASGLEQEVTDGILRLTFNRPDVYNAMTAEMSDQLAAAVEGTASRDDVRLILISGKGEAFCTGADIGGDEAHTRFDSTALDRANRVTRAIMQTDVPVLAAVNGVAAGVGASTVFACDLAVARESASFVLAFSRIGLMPDGGATATVAAAIGRARAMRLALLGERLPARAAYDAGLISHLAGDSVFDKAVEELAGQLVAGSPLAFAATKRAINAATLAGIEDALQREHRGQSLLLRTADAAEGMRAFGERRPAQFTGE